MRNRRSPRRMGARSLLVMRTLRDARRGITREDLVERTGIERPGLCVVLCRLQQREFVLQVGQREQITRAGSEYLNGVEAMGKITESYMRALKRTTPSRLDCE